MHSKQLLLTGPTSYPCTEGPQTAVTLESAINPPGVSPEEAAPSSPPPVRLHSGETLVITFPERLIDWSDKCAQSCTYGIFRAG